MYCPGWSHGEGDCGPLFVYIRGSDRPTCQEHPQILFLCELSQFSKCWQLLLLMFCYCEPNHKNLYAGDNLQCLSLQPLGFLLSFCSSSWEFHCAQRLGVNLQPWCPLSISDSYNGLLDMSTWMSHWDLKINVSTFSFHPLFPNISQIPFLPLSSLPDLIQVLGIFPLFITKHL